MGTQHFPALQVISKPSQQSEAVSQPEAPRPTQHVPSLHVAVDSQQSVSALHALEIPVGPQHCPDSPQTSVDPGKSQHWKLDVQPASPMAMQHCPRLQVSLSLQQSAAALHEAEAPLGAQHFPSLQVTVPDPSSQQSRKSSHPALPMAMQQVPKSSPGEKSHVALGLQQSAVVEHDSLAPVGAQHLPSSQIATPKEVLQQSLPNELVHPVAPSGMQHVLPSHVAFASQQSPGS